MNVSRGVAAVCASALSCLLGAASARADEAELAPSKVGVSYRAPAGCPNVGTFMLLLAQHLKSGDNAPLYAQVEISEAPPLYRLELTVYASALPLRSEELARSCDELVRLAAFMAAVARIQPLPNDSAPEPPDDPPSHEEIREEPPVPSAELVPRAPNIAPRATGARWLAAGQVQGGVGLLPGVTLGTGLVVELAWQNFALRSTTNWWLPSEAAPTRSLDSLVPLTLTLQAVDLAACLRQSVYAWATHELSVGACGVVSGYRLGAESPQSGGASGVAYRGGLGLSVGAMCALPAALEVGVELGLSELANPLRARIEPYREAMYESRGSQIRLALLLGFRFGGDG